MDDVALYTAYYSAYHVRAAEAAALPSTSRKGQRLVCAFLAFGAACGVSTVAVGFLAHKPAIIWPVVSIGVVGAFIGLMLANWGATRGRLWSSPGPRLPIEPLRPGYLSQAAGGTTPNGDDTVVGGAGTDGGSGGCPRGMHHFPMYCADALDVEMGIVHPSYLPPYALPARALPGKVTNTSQEFHAGTAGSEAGDRCSGACSSSGEEMEEVVAGKAAGLPSVEAVAAGYGTVMCGFPLPGADGWIDTRPVLVLQPQLLSRQPPSPPRPSCDDAGAQEAPAAAAAVAAPPPRLLQTSLQRGDAADLEATAAPAAAAATGGGMAAVIPQPSSAVARP